MTNTAKATPRPLRWDTNIGQIIDGNGVTVMCCLADDDLGPEIVTAVNEYDALKAVEAAGRGAVTLASQGLQAISDALTALDAIRKGD